MKIKVMVSTKDDEEIFLRAVEEYYFGTRVYLDRPNLCIRVSSNKDVICRYRRKKGRLQAYRIINLYN